MEERFLLKVTRLEESKQPGMVRFGKSLGYGSLTVGIRERRRNCLLYTSDVYKRQVLPIEKGADCVVESVLMRNVSYIPIVIPVVHTMGRSVSYTHLDVYKRQGVVW